MLFRSTSRILLTVFLFSVLSQAQSFTRSEYAVGSQPNSVVTADFNGDGVADLAVTNSGDSAVSILIGRGDGTFGAASSVAVGAGPTEIIAADFNADGKPDLAVANSNGASLTVLIGNGDGTFRRADVSVGGGQASLAAGDFNGDGKTDLAVGVGNNVRILLGNGDGSFSTGSSFATAVSPKQIRAADLNADGKVDLAIGACCQGSDVTYGAFYVYQGNGDGTFTQKFSSDQSDGTKLTVADVTADGLPDLVMPYVGCHTPCDGVEVIVNNGNFGFTRFGGGGDDGGLTYGGRGPAAVADFNGDGHAEVASSAGPGNGGSGSGNDYVLIWTVGADGKFGVLNQYLLGKNTGPWGMISADFNHDGKADLAVVESHTGKVAVLLNSTGSANAQQAFEFSMQFSPQTVPAGSGAKYEYDLEATNGTLPTVQFSCSGLPTGAACSFDPQSANPISQGWLTIATTPRSSAAVHRSFGWFALALPFGFVMLPVRGRKLVWLTLLVIALAVMIEVGCASGGKNLMSAQSSGATGAGTSAASTGGSNNASGTSSTGNTSSGASNGSTSPAPDPPAASGPTPAGSYQVTVTATGGGVTQTQVVTLVVQ